MVKLIRQQTVSSQLYKQQHVSVCVWLWDLCCGNTVCAASLRKRHTAEWTAGTNDAEEAGTSGQLQNNITVNVTPANRPDPTRNKTHPSSTPHLLKHQATDEAVIIWQVHRLWFDCKAQKVWRQLCRLNDLWSAPPYRHRSLWYWS